MTRLFHAAAGAIILAAIWLTFHRPPARATAYDPQAHLVDVLHDAGLTYAARKEIAQGEALLTFSQIGCAAPTSVIYMPWVSRTSPPVRAFIERAPAPPLFVIDGEVVDGIGMTEVMPRWAWRRLLIFLNLKHDEPWTSIKLAVMAAPGCPLPPIDWSRLTRR